MWDTKRGLDNLLRCLRTTERIERGDIATAREAYLEYRRCGLAAEDAWSLTKATMALRKARAH